jgi:hypothetical protein
LEKAIGFSQDAAVVRWFRLHHIAYYCFRSTHDKIFEKESDA